MEDDLRLIDKKAIKALDFIQKKSVLQKTDKLTDAEIEKEIVAVRRIRRQRRTV